MGPTPIHDRNEIWLILGATTAALAMGALLDRKRHMADIAVNLRWGLEGNRLRADDAGDLATNDDLSARDHSRHLSFLADEDLGRLNVTFNLTIDLQDARAAGLIRSNDRD